MPKPNFSPPGLARMLVGLVCLLALFSASGSLMADPYTWRLRMLPAAAVSGDQALLGEIAEPEGQIDPEAWKILSATPLWSIPPQDGQLILNRVKILEDLDRYFPSCARNFDVPEQVILHKGPARPVSQGDMFKLIVDFLTDKLGAKEGELDIKELTQAPQMFVDPDTETISLESLGEVDPGRISLRVNVANQEGRVLRQGTFAVFANLWRMIPVASKAITPHDGELSEDKVGYERRNLAFVHGAPWDARGQAMRVKTPVMRGTPLTSENIEPMPDILKGDQITVVWSSQRIHLSMPATAITDGSKGGRITVRGTQGGKEIAAVVLDPKTVSAK